jgi:ankyrin repeat protein
MDININQREFEFSGMENREWMSPWTALHCAVYSNAPRCMRFLLANGIDAGLRDISRQTARDLPMKVGNEEQLKVLDELALYC